MPQVIPFKAVRPAADKAGLVASRSYVSYSDEDLRQKLDSNPYSFIHVIQPEYQLPEKDRTKGRDRFEKVREKYLRFIAEDIFRKDDCASLYFYSQIGPGGSYHGWIAGVSCDDYDKGKIKKHEQTLSARQSVFTDYLDFTGFNAEPVLLAYENSVRLSELKQKVMQDLPTLDFTTTDKIRHQIRVVSDPALIGQIQAEFESLSDFYIADGHHRSASSSALRARRKESNRNHTGHEPYNYFLALLLPDSDLKILSFHRMVSDLGEMSEAEFVERIKVDFNIEDLKEPIQPKRGQILFHTKLGSRLLKPKSWSTATGNIDADLLTDRILSPILGIRDLRTDQRIWFNGGPGAFEEMQIEVATGRAAAGFALAPCNFEDVKIIADRGSIMPPKSTWVEPKLRSGLTIYDLNE
jgi:uncharacterized protein (DUF1015 family)